MKESSKATLFVVCLLVLLVGVLGAIGTITKSDWGTFVPDLIVGVITAGGIAGLIALLQMRSDARRQHEARVSVAYEGALDALTRIQTLDFRKVQEDVMSSVGTRLINLYEAVDDELVGAWFEAERQLGISKALQASELTNALAADASVDEILAASEPFHRWVHDFASRVRYWRSGRITKKEMRDTATDIEAVLRKRKQWREPL